MRSMLLLAFLLTGCASAQLRTLAKTDPVTTVTVRERTYDIRVGDPQDGTLDVLVRPTRFLLTILGRGELFANMTQAAQQAVEDICLSPNVIQTGPVDIGNFVHDFLVRFSCDPTHS